MTTRKQIRDQIRVQILATYTGEVFSGRQHHSLGIAEFVDIFFDEGENVEDGIQQYCEAIVSIGIHKTGIVTDDDLDAIEALCEAGIFADLTLSGLVHGMHRNSFSYSPQGENTYDILVRRYVVIYEEDTP